MCLLLVVSRRRGVTLLECFVLLGIIVVLIALLTPGILLVTEASNKTACASHMRQIGLAFADYALDRRHYPMGGGDCFSPASWVDTNDVIHNLPLPGMPRIPSFYTAGVGEAGSIAPSGIPAQRTEYQDWGWGYQILPYIDQDKLWRLPAGAENDGEINRATIPVYFCPSKRAPEPGGLDYVGNGGAFAINNVWPHPPNAKVWTTRHFKEDFPNVQSPGRVYRNGAIVKNRFWPRAPHEAWDTPVYVDTPLRPEDIRDGMSNTLLLGEGNAWSFTSGFAGCTAAASTWTNAAPGVFVLTAVDHPVRLGYKGSESYSGFASVHNRAMNALFLDGSVRSISYTMSTETQSVPVWVEMVDQTPGGPNMDLSVFQRLCHRFDGSVVEASQFE